MKNFMINENSLLLLIMKENSTEESYIDIEVKFQSERIFLSEICKGSDDNIEIINQYVKGDLKYKLPDTTLNYCKELDKAYQRVEIKVDRAVVDFENRRNLIYLNQKEAIEIGEAYDLKKEIRSLKQDIKEQIESWFKAVEIQFAYEKAKINLNCLVFSHRISGWSNPEFKLTKCLRLQIKSNFGYGSASYFYVILVFNDIKITPFSEWIDYRYSQFSEVIRYTKSFSHQILKLNNGKLLYTKRKIFNSSWKDAISFTRIAANMAISDEKEFIKKYIIEECEYMINGLEKFYNENKFDFYIRTEERLEEVQYRVDYNGFELIDFRTEKIIGALEFLEKLREYNSIVPTLIYENRLFEVNKKFVPHVNKELDNQMSDLNNTQKEYLNFLPKHKNIVNKNKFYENEKNRLGEEFNHIYLNEYNSFETMFLNSIEIQNRYLNKIKLHTNNYNKLFKYLEKYKVFLSSSSR